MARIIKDLYQRFCDENIVGKYIYATVAVYVLFALIGVVATLFNATGFADGFVSIFRLPADAARLIMQPWSIVTYMFMHAGFMHLLWNMLALYVFGRIFITFYSTRHFIGAYILGGIVGGLFFVLAYNIFPFFEGRTEGSCLVGASAAVLAVVVASAVRSPHYTCHSDGCNIPFACEFRQCWRQYRSSWRCVGWLAFCSDAQQGTRCYYAHKCSQCCSC